MPYSCKTCKSSTESMFYPSIKTYCKEHWRARVKESRESNSDHYRSYDRARASTPERIAARKAYVRTPSGREAANRAKAAWRARNKLRAAAHAAVAKALMRGKMERWPCEVCGEQAEAHHPSYDMPLTVVWLCDVHHKEVHKMAKAI